eukprot:scaffold1832_cov362-Prasinococcus_capsulatus_cf.AAC.6
MKVAIVGDHGVGKTSLVATYASSVFPSRPPPTLPTTSPPKERYPYPVPVQILDTRLDDIEKLTDSIAEAHVILLLYDCSSSGSLRRLKREWMQPYLAPKQQKLLRASRLQKVPNGNTANTLECAPVVLVGCKLDARGKTGKGAARASENMVSISQHDVEKYVRPLMEEFANLETCLECSAKAHVQVNDVFIHAIKAVLDPITPLVDSNNSLRPRCIRALQRVFMLCDLNGDGALDDSEINVFQLRVYGVPLSEQELINLKKMVKDTVPEGVNEKGLAPAGFRLLHLLFVRRQRPEFTWAALRTFGYKTDLTLRETYTAVSMKNTAKNVIELKLGALEWLESKFNQLDTKKAGTLSSLQTDMLFCTAPQSMWKKVYDDSFLQVEHSVNGEITLEGFLTKWQFEANHDVQRANAYLLYLVGMVCYSLVEMGYTDGYESAFKASKRRRSQARRSSRAGYCECFVFGPDGGSRKILLSALTTPPQTGGEQGAATASPFSRQARIQKMEGQTYVANRIAVPKLGLIQDKCTLVLKQIPQEEQATSLEDISRSSGCPCDVAAFVYDAHSPSSFKFCMEQVQKLASSSSKVPCILFAAIGRAGMDPSVNKQCMAFCSDIGLAPPTLINLDELTDSSAKIYKKIVTTALNGSAAIPETEEQRLRKQQEAILKNVLVYGGIAVGVVGLSLYAYKWYKRVTPKEASE